MGLFSFTKSRRYREFMAKVYGLGASVVLIGALFKINHYAGADIMLIIGLGTEAIIFFFSAFEPPFTEPDWSLVYPELAGMYHDVEGGELKQRKSPTERLDEMLEKAQIDNQTIERLGEGMAKLSENAGQLNDLGGAAAASSNFATNVGAAAASAKKFGDLVEKDATATVEYADSLNRVTEGASSLALAYEGAADVLKSDTYEDQLRRIADNMAALSEFYETQLKGTVQAVESTDRLQTTMSIFLEKLEQSTESTSEFTDQMSTLTSRMTSLNKVYGNMLSAMNVGG